MVGTIKFLYTGADHPMRFGGRSVYMGTLLHGTKQGCPPSPIIFVLVVDILLHVMESRTSLDLGGFADDMASASEIA